jgi:hypothetical protein
MVLAQPRCTAQRRRELRFTIDRSTDRRCDTIERRRAFSVLQILGALLCGGFLIFNRT